MDDKVKGLIKGAKDKYEKTAALDMQVLEIPNFGKKDCKKYGVSPDAIMQLGFQVITIIYSTYVPTAVIT